MLHAAETFARQHFVDVLQSEEFMSLTSRQLSRLIADDELNVQGEERVFEAVLAWIKYDPEIRYVSFVIRYTVCMCLPHGECEKSILEIRSRFFSALAAIIINKPYFANHAKKVYIKYMVYF